MSREEGSLSSLTETDSDEERADTAAEEQEEERVDLATPGLAAPGAGAEDNIDWGKKRNTPVTLKTSSFLSLMAAPSASASEPKRYNTHLEGELETGVGDVPKARVHSREWAKIQKGVGG